MENMNTIYRKRLCLETDVKVGSIYHDLDNEEFRDEKRELKRTVQACDSEDNYKRWKKEYIKAEYEKLKDSRFLVCSYMFIGVDSYEAVILEEDLDCFKAWINGNGSAFLTGTREANEKEIKQYIALHAMDKQ